MQARVARNEHVAKRHTTGHIRRVDKTFLWDEAKNTRLAAERGVSFDEIVFHIMNGDLVDVIEHPNQEKYAGQRVLVVNVEGYIHLVPFEESERAILLRTIIPSRKATKKYLRGADHET